MESQATARLLTEGFDGEVITRANSWAEVYAAFQNRTIIQVEAKGARIYTFDQSVEMPALQVQIEGKNSIIMGMIPAHEAGLKNPTDEDRSPGLVRIPETAEELARLSSREKKDIVTRLERRLVGSQVWILIVAVDRKNETFIASRKRALDIMAKQAWKRIKEGEIVYGTVRELFRRSAILDLGGVEAFMRNREMSWGFTNDPADALTLGATYEVKVIAADREADSVEVSLKQASDGPWPGCANRYPKDGTYSGTVSGVAERGIHVTLEPGVTVFAHQPKFTRVQPGDKVKVTVTFVDTERKFIAGRIADSRQPSMDVRTPSYGRVVTSGRTGYKDTRPVARELYPDVNAVTETVADLTETAAEVTETDEHASEQPQRVRKARTAAPAAAPEQEEAS